MCHSSQTMEFNVPKSHSFHLLILIIILLASSTFSSSSSSENAEIISRFQQYLRINTSHPTPNWYEAADFLVSQAKSLSLKHRVIEFVKGKPIVLLKWPGTKPDLPAIILYSHTDVVAAEPEKWKYHPFSAHIDEDGNIYARGIQDMKCVGMQYLEAIRRLQASGFKPLRTVYLAYGPDEELGGHEGAEKFADSDLFKSLNIGAGLDEGLASPRDSYRVFYGEKSPWWLVMKATGEPGHGSWMYDNSAWENLLKGVENIIRFRTSQFDLVKQGVKVYGDVVSVNLAYLKAGTPVPDGFVMNVQPTEAEAGFDIMVPPTADPKSLEQRIAEEWAPQSRNMTFSFVEKEPVLMDGKPIITKPDSSNPWWVLLKDAIEKAGGKLETPEIFQASTDSRYFRRKGVPAFGFSPMSNTPVLLHEHNEYLNRDEYLKGIGIYESIIKAYASYDEENTGNGESKDVM